MKDRKFEASYSNPEELMQVKKDLVRVLVLNGILLALLIGLYFLNRTSGTLDQLSAKLLKF